ncbi:MAG: hypothetical protein J4478_00105 [Candidatus Diapherotrites archaeon]|uniref:4-vinyl reductase 4VR domain-containing protein n=1 Tax=Candidatus Iainarchaeum sp. TaxID=3101447 RepID=A0A7J4KUC4_9ARCH|nr:hypothetical protein [Candidatus Diapherotrites archaeon]HIH21149.1 hypothetical protein [Candidatus Diapherotrites archaeon]HIH32749.1 hypothetical protein [Candidatus Diapherotrites archaeon]
MEEGRISLFRIPIAIVPVDFESALVKRLFDKVGFDETFDILYTEAKRGAIDYCVELKKNTSAKGHELANLYAQIITMSGYGKATVTDFDPLSKKVFCRFDNSPIATRYIARYGKSKFPLDIITCGFYAGSFNVLFDADYDAFEVSCIGRGDPFCNFVYGEPKYIQELRKVRMEQFLSK